MSGTDAIVCGSGIDLRGLFNAAPARIGFAEAGLPEASVSGHAGAFFLGTHGGRRLVLQCGRLHVYEGHSLALAAAAVDALHERFGVTRILFTNAVGGLRPEMAAGSLAAVRRIRPWAYRHAALPEEVALPLVVPGCDFEGTYWWVHGPSYETRAEIAALRSLDGDVVGMSALPEALRCAALGIPAAVVSCVTNNCCVPGVLSHAEVVARAEESAARLESVARSWLRE